ncbi:MAG: ribulose 1,5-bisphosphate carboxylase, partial [Pandoraea sp.]|nr:ribulose 1,5-bisphosphate carboxylase [Pandoraea sp.]
LAGVDHMHVHGLQGKFAQGDEEVIESAHDCYAPLAVDAAEQDIARDQVMPAFSSGQWAGTVPATWRAVGRDDLLFMAGGGILAHPDGPAAGVQSLRDAWAAVRAGQSLEAASRDAPALAAALRFFGH